MVPSSRCRGQATQKTPDSIPAFQTSCREQLQQLIPTAATRPVRVFSQDESRFGLLTVRRRRLTARGIQPIGGIQHTFEWFYLYGAVAPCSGEAFFLALPQLNADNFQLFLDGLAHVFPDSLNVVVLDKSGAHTAKRLIIPENIRLLPLPAYCPELSPIERVWRDLKDELAWEQFSDILVQQDRVADLVCAYDPASLQSLTAYPYFVEAVNALCP